MSKILENKKRFELNKKLEDLVRKYTGMTKGIITCLSICAEVDEITEVKMTFSL